MQKNFISLNGDWSMQYLGKDVYSLNTEPQLTEGYFYNNAVPCYWEDMLDAFRENPTHTSFTYNPHYTLQRYPQAGYVPDMALPTIVGTFLYTRKINLELCDIEGDVVLSVGGVQNALSAWINGKYLGKHEGYSSSFSFAAHKSILQDGENTVTLVVSNELLKGYKGRVVSGCTNRAANQYTGGIYGDVQLIYYKDGLKGAHVSTSKDLSGFTVLCIGGENVQKQVLIKDGEKLIYSQTLSAGERNVEFSAQNMEFWSPDNPKRYTLIVSTENQTIEKTFGLRRLSVAEDGLHLKLNGKAFFFRGICEHGYYPKTVHPTSLNQNMFELCNKWGHTTTLVGGVTVQAVTVL
jgi:beta-galactosidase/beta-glucuronidase